MIAGSVFSGIGGSDSARYRMLGNAVPPVVVAWIGRRLLAVDRELDQR